MRLAGSGGTELAVRDVHRDFKAETQVGKSWGSPLHSLCLLNSWRENGCQLVAAVAFTSCIFNTAISMPCQNFFCPRFPACPAAARAPAGPRLWGWRRRATVAWLIACSGLPVASPGWCCMAVPAAAARRIRRGFSGWSASASSCRTSAARACRAHAARARATIPTNWWPI